MKGYFEIGIYHGKSVCNFGTLWRSAFQMGACGVFTIGSRHRHQASDTTKTWRHVPYRQFVTFADFVAALPYSAPLVACEMGGEPLEQFVHPPRAIYLLGAEDHGLPPAILAACHYTVSLNSIRVASYNVATAGSIVMYHRQFWGSVATSRCADRQKR
jgi:tRNA G18 (ribose-2'-O)-methylase SpoU